MATATKPLTIIGISRSLDIKEVTVKEVFEAIKKNGFDHIRSNWIITSDGKPVGACVLGQGALNLGVAAEYNYYGNINNLVPGYSDMPWPQQEKAHTAITRTAKKHSLIAQLNKFKADKGSKWVTGEAGSSRAGDLIVYWNDAREYVSEDDFRDYRLKTYEEVVDMAYDILKPHFDEKLELLSVVYDN